MNNVNVSPVQPPSSANVTWDPVSLPSSSPASQYQVVYRPLSSTIVQFTNVDLSESATILTGLQDSSRYEIYVRLVCGDPESVGNLSDAVELTLVDASTFYLFLRVEGGISP